MTVLQSNRSPRQYEPVSSRRYATRRGKGILRLETAGGCDRHRPKISVSLGLILRSECASAGYVGDIQRDWKSCNIKYLHGGAEGIRTDGHRTMPLVRSETVAEYGTLTANPAFPLSVRAEADPRGQSRAVGEHGQEIGQLRALRP